jgi:hypothetical protein
MIYLFIAAIIIIILCISKQSENYTNTNCDGITSYDKKCGQNFGYSISQCQHVPQHKQLHKSNYNYSTINNSFDCYNQCITNADCKYTGIYFDCYNNCFNNFAPQDNDPLTPTKPDLFEKF